MPAATKVAAGEEVQIAFKAEFAPNLPRPGLVGVAVNGVYHTCTPGAPKPTATVKVSRFSKTYFSFFNLFINLLRKKTCVLLEILVINFLSFFGRYQVGSLSTQPTVRAGPSTASP